jgi:uncharacterized protein (TIGR02453 family)
MANSIIQKASLDFLTTLSQNNNREWFNIHKDEYIEARDNIIDFADTLLVEMNKHDRIVRFSKDKTPYNTLWSASFKRATRNRRGGYYFRIEPGNSGLVAGFWGPDADDMKRIRQDIDANYPYWQDLLGEQTLAETFGRMYGGQLGSPPRGYAKDHLAIELLRYKQFMLRHLFTDAEVLSPDFVFKMNDVFKKTRPFLDFMSEVLTTDVNGVPLID